MVLEVTGTKKKMSPEALSVIDILNFTMTNRPLTVRKTAALFS